MCITSPLTPPVNKKTASNGLAALYECYLHLTLTSNLIEQSQQIALRSMIFVNYFLELLTVVVNTIFVTISDQVRQLLKAGKHPSEIWKRVQCSRALISRVRKQLGIPKFKRGPRSNYDTVWGRPRTQASLDRENQMRMLKELGMSYAELAAKFKVTKQAICSTLHNGKKSGSGRCEICKKLVDHIHRHHLNYVKKITQQLCVSCHMKKHGRGHIFESK